MRNAQWSLVILLLFCNTTRNVQSGIVPEHDVTSSYFCCSPLVLQSPSVRFTFSRILWICYPPWRVEINTMLSFSCISYSNSPMSSQSASFINTKIPGRTDSPCIKSSGLSFSKLSLIQTNSLFMFHGFALFGKTTSCSFTLLNKSSAPPLKCTDIFKPFSAIFLN